MKCCRHAAVAALFWLVTGFAYADEAPFLQSLAGDWTGGGMMKRTTSSSPINLSCNFTSQASGEALSMKGTCRGGFPEDRIRHRTDRRNDRHTVFR